MKKGPLRGPLGEKRKLQQWPELWYYGVNYLKKVCKSKTLSDILFAERLFEKRCENDGYRHSNETEGNSVNLIELTKSLDSFRYVFHLYLSPARV